MLSRAATDMYWTARYLERAASMLRLLEVSYLLDLDRQEGSPPQWEPLIWITGDMALFRSLYPEASPWNVMRFLVLDVDYPNSVVACLEKARANTKGLREELPAPLWTEINRQGTALVKAATQDGISHSRVLRLCRETNRTHMLILGMVSETMAHDEAYRLWQLGTYIERADKTSRLLHVK